MAHLEKPPIALGFSHDGVDDYVEVPDSASLDLVSEGTIAVWIYLRAKGFAVPLAKGAGGGWVTANYQLRLPLDTSDLYIVVGDGTDFNGAYATLTLNEWAYFVGIFDGTSLKAYLNGVLIDTVSQTVTPATNNLMLGIGRAGSDNLGYTNVIINEVCIYNRALSLAEISDLYSIRRNIMDGCVLKLGTAGLVRGGGTQWLDESPYKNHGTVYGAKRVRCCHCNVVRDYGT